MKKTTKILLSLIGALTFVVLIFIGFIIVANTGSTENTNEDTGLTENQTIEKLTLDDVHSDSNPVATINVQDYGTMTFELFPEYAPQSVANFVELSNSGFYDGLIFHRVINDFVIQGGDPDGTGAGGPGYAITGEFASNRFENQLTHIKGSLSWARSTYPDSAGSQFYIADSDVSSSLDGNYATFGYMTSGEEVLDAISSVETDESDAPVESVVIESVTIEMNDYKQVEVNKLGE